MKKHIISFKWSMPNIDPRRKWKHAEKESMLKINVTTNDLLNHLKCYVLIHSEMCRY